MPGTSANIYPALTYDDAAAAIEWLCTVFGFRKRLVVPSEGGGVMHSELTFGDGVIMVSSPKPEWNRVGPMSANALTSSLSVYVADPDAHCERAKLGGARIIREVQDEEYGARGYMAEDPEGHLWYFGTYVPGAWWDADAREESVKSSG